MNLSRWVFPGIVSFSCFALACSSGSGGAAHSGDGGLVGDGGPVEPDAGDDSSSGDGSNDTHLTSGNPTGLWVGGLYAYALPSLANSGSPTFDDECPIPNDGASSTPAAFDGSGNLWVQQAGDSTMSIIEWSAAQLSAACSTGKPARTITLVAQETVDQISSMAFDKHGTLWMSVTNDAVLMGVTSAQLAASGTVTPAYFVQYGGVYARALAAPMGIAFDPAGNLWVGNVYSVLEYSPATLASSLSDGRAASPAADAYLSTAESEVAAMDNQTTSPPLAQMFKYPAFDRSGNLWVSGSAFGAQDNAEYVAEYAASDLANVATNQTPTPRVVLHETAEMLTNLEAFGAIVFDSSGNLWLGANADLFRYPVASLQPATGGAGGPYDIALTNLAWLTGNSLAFNPIPAGLPILP
jgi:hypothetical protein